jgi:hypothetical protein
MCYIGSTPKMRRPVGLLADQAPVPDLQRTTPMTIEILYLTAQIHRWLNERVARHLAAQAAKLTH